MNAQSIPKFRKHQEGISIISAIFLIVMLAGLGAAMLNISGAQHTSSALDLEGVRAYRAARAGIEWGVHRIVNAPATCFDSPSTFSAQPGVAPSLAAYTIVVTCEQTQTGGLIVYQITSTACNQPAAGNCAGGGGSPFYVERQLQATVGG